MTSKPGGTFARIFARALVVALGTAWIVASPSPAPAQQGEAEAAASAKQASTSVLPKVGLNSLIQKSDSIVAGRVIGRQAQWVNGNIETTYIVEVTQDYKGDLGATRGSVEIAVRGGNVEGVPIGQLVRDNPHLVPDEEVILFLETDVAEMQARAQARRQALGLAPIEDAPESKLGKTPRIVGRRNGKFSILRTPEGGTYVTRYNPVGALLDDNSQRLMREYQLHRLQQQESKKTFGGSRASVGFGDGATRAAAAQQTKPRSPRHAEELASQNQKPESRELDPRLIPYNQDALAVPVTFDTFEKELLRLIDEESGS